MTQQERTCSKTQVDFSRGVRSQPSNYAVYAPEEESWCSCDEDACHERTRRAGRGAVDQKFVKYLSESSNFVKKTPTLFSFEILGNEMRHSQLCKVYSSGGTFCFGTSSRKYRRSKSALAGVLHAVV